MDEPLSIQVRFQDEDVDQAKAALTSEGAGELKYVAQKGAVGIETLMLAILAAQGLANLLIVYLRLWKCGVIVDTRGPKVEVEKNCDIPRGSVMIVSGKDTRTLLDKPTPFQLEAMIKSLMSKSG